MTLPACGSTHVSNGRLGVRPHAARGDDVRQARQLPRVAGARQRLRVSALPGDRRAQHLDRHHEVVGERLVGLQPIQQRRVSAIGRVQPCDERVDTAVDVPDAVEQTAVDHLLVGHAATGQSPHQPPERPTTIAEPPQPPAPRPGLDQPVRFERGRRLR